MEVQKTRMLIEMKTAKTEVMRFQMGMNDITVFGLVAICVIVVEESSNCIHI